MLRCRGRLDEVGEVPRFKKTHGFTAYDRETSQLIEELFGRLVKLYEPLEPHQRLTQVEVLVEVLRQVTPVYEARLELTLSELASRLDVNPNQLIQTSERKLERLTKDRDKDGLSWQPVDPDNRNMWYTMVHQGELPGYDRGIPHTTRRSRE